MNKFKSYKYYTGLTSQVGFCATPLRLDPYNKCQYGCGYCFASTRQGHGRSRSFQVANPDSLRNRLERVHNGEIASAVDEMIARRVPFQLGGMSDPFTPIESQLSVTKSYIEILNRWNYPFIISTKSVLVAEKPYISALSDSNCYVRFSITGINPADRKLVDRGCPDVESIGKAAKELSANGVPICFRFQPIIPGHERFLTPLVSLAVESGVKHISAEFLKVPIDANKKFSQPLRKLMNDNPISYMKNLGAVRQGREYVLPLEYRASPIINLATDVRSKGLTFGFADNDLLLYSDGMACCGASDLYLRESNFFTANITYLAKSASIGSHLKFEEFLSSWMPKYAISTYLNSKARITGTHLTEPEWLEYLKEMWKGNLGIYSPNYFDGICDTGIKDDNGMPIYQRIESSFERCLRERAQLSNI